MRTAAIVLSLVVVILFAGCKKTPAPNSAPEVPTDPSGVPSGWVDSLYSYRAVSVDPDGDSVSIRFDWGDGDTSAWCSYVPSGDSASMSHSWSSPGVFTVKAQAKDANDTASAWSDGRVVAVTRGWAKTFGGASYDWGNSVQQTQDGGYVIVGLTDSYGSGYDDVWLIKADANGSTVWDRTFGGPGPEEGNSVQQTSDGGYIITGCSESYGAGSGDVWLIKTDADGNQTWDKTFGGSDYDEGASVQQTQDGGYIVVGRTSSYGAGDFDVWLIKTDASGDTMWTRTYGGTGYDLGYSVGQTQDGGYIVTGFTKSYASGNGGLLLFKTDADGNTVWDEAFGGGGSDGGSSVQQTSDGGYIVAGTTNTRGAGSVDIWLLKTDADGDTTWTKTLGGSGAEEGYSVQQTDDGGYVVTGSTTTYGAGENDVWLIKTDANGDLVWSRTFGGSSYECGHSARQTRDGGYVATGFTSSRGAGSMDVWLIKVDAAGLTDGGSGK